MSAREAAARLGVKPETLYAYVARGLLRSREGERGRERRYAARDVEALLARKAARRSPETVASGALHWGVPVIESKLALIDGGRLYYRGHDAAALAGRARFEQVAELLWTGALGEAAWDEGTTARRAREVLAPFAAALREAPPFARLQIAAPVLAVADAARFGMDAAQLLATARRLVVGLATALGERAAPRDAGVSGRVLAALSGPRASGDARAVAAVDAALVLSAEHELNASTFAARVAASAGADPWAVVCAALATLTGPKHGGTCDRVEALVAEAKSPDDATRVLVARAARGDAVPGFGHPLYPAGDPRVPPLLALAERIGGARAETALALVRAVAEQGGPAPALDTALVALAHALELPPGSAGALFAIGRTAGWMAHAIEQYASDAMIRPRARYVGPSPEEHA